ncbi:MAG: hypothetical protein GC161_08060 [Planctomycetaceae bacterium]|nr:hypothetical protein [Planctomycetaceae bacterium]
MATAPAIDVWLLETRRWSDAALEASLTRCFANREEGLFVPARLEEAMRYAILGGGKRLRPALVRLFAEELGGTADAATAPAVALELVHTYSLVHDDLPAMDDDDLRRGRPTCHVVYGEALGILVGDALQTLAFEELARLGPRGAELVLVLARAAGARGMVGGQVLDLLPASRPGSPGGPEGIRAVHRAKTAALFAAAAEMGALVAAAGAGAVAGARRFGLALGLGFQAVDDVLDVTGDAATLGKTPGKDAALERDTLVAALGLDGARREAAERAQEARAALSELGLAEGSLPFLLVEHLLQRRS